MTGILVTGKKAAKPCGKRDIPRRVQPCVRATHTCCGPQASGRDGEGTEKEQGQQELAKTRKKTYNMKKVFSMDVIAQQGDTHVHPLVHVSTVLTQKEE